MSASDSNERIYAVTRIRAVTPGATDLQINGVSPRALYLGTAGDVTVLADDDVDPVTMHNLAAGMWHPTSARRVTALSNGAANCRVGY